MRPSGPSQHLKVVCRIRPSADGSCCVFAVEGRNSVGVSTTPVSPAQMRNAQTADGLSCYDFDQVISESSRQGEVFETLVESYVRDLLTGRSSSILLFGPTGSGKSYTVRGGEGKERGVLLRAVEAFIYLSSKQRAVYSLYAQALLIYEDKAVELSYSDSPLKRVADLVLLLQRALRTRKDFCASQGDKNIKEKAHFLVSLSVMRDSSALSRLDIVELAGSEQAADRQIAASFNALSAVLTRTGTVRGHKLCSQLEQTLDIYNEYNPSQVLLICTTSPEKSQLKHSLAAVKFASRIRESLLQERSREDFLTRELTEIEREVDGAERPNSNVEVGRWITRREQRLAELELNAGNETSSTNLLSACSSVRRKLELLRENWLSSQSPSRVTPKFETMPIKRHKRVKFSRSSSADRLMSPTPMKTERVLESSQSPNSSFKESPISRPADMSDSSIHGKSAFETKEGSPLTRRHGSRYDTSPRKADDDKGGNSRLMARVDTLLLEVENLEDAKRGLEAERVTQEAKIRAMEQQMARVEGRKREGSRSPIPMDDSSSPSVRSNNEKLIQAKIEIQEAKGHGKKLQQQLSDALETIKGLNNDLETQNREIERLRALNEELTSKSEAFEHEKSQFERIFDQIYHEKLETERSLQSANATKQTLKNEMKLQQEQLGDLRESLLVSKNELQKAAENEALLLERNQDLDRDVKAGEATIRDLERKVAALQSEKRDESAECRDEFSPLHQEVKDILEEQVVRRLIEIERKLDRRQGNSEELEELTEANSQLQQENSHLRAVNESLSGELQAVTDKLRADQSAKEVRRLKEQVKDCEETIYDLKTKLIAANTEKKQILDSQQEMYRDKEIFRRDLQETHQKIDEEKTALEQKLRAVKREADTSADRSQEAKAKLESMGMELTKARLETMHFQIENNQLLAKLEAIYKQTPETELRARRIAERLEHLKELSSQPCATPAITEAVREESLRFSDSAELEEDIVFDQSDEEMDVNPNSLSKER